MKKLLLSILIIFSVGFLQANEKNVTPKKIMISSDQDEKNVDVKVDVENEIIKLVIKKDGEENVYEVNLKDKKAFKALEEELEDLDVDVNISGLLGNDHDHQMMLFGNKDQHDFHVGGGGFLGVQIQDITDQLRDYFKVKGDGGVLVTEVVKDSPAAKADIEAGDIIVRVDDNRISDAGELTHTIRNEKPETKVDITVIRKGREISFKATLGSSDDSFSLFGNMGELHNKGMMKKFKYKCDEDTSPGCRLKDGYSFNYEGVVPDEVPDTKKHKVFMQKGFKSDEFQSLKKELEELREEIQKLKE
ncbi:MAG: S1C family serine protease [Fidelibacterota bacterium]